MIEFSDVTVTRGGRHVLKGVSLTVPAGELVALIGASGSGKTTMLRLVNRLIEPDTGVVRVSGRPVRDWDPVTLRRSIGYVIQEVGLFPHLSIERNIAIVPRLVGMDERHTAARVDELLALVGLEANTYRRRWPDELSGGQRQRVGLARALAAHPPVLLMDEPFGAVDQLTRVDLHRQFKRLRAAMPQSVLLVTHDLNEAFALADRVAVLEQGVIVECASPSDLRRSSDPIVRALLDSRYE
jgi:osmoprotectant transport system ATP-binding protein